MLSIQQVIKAIRKLPANGDLAKVLKYAALAGNEGGHDEAPVTSSLSTLQLTSSSSLSSSKTQAATTATTTTTLPKQPQQTIGSSQQQMEAENSPHETQTSRRSNKLAANAVSFVSQLNESGSHLEARISTTQDQKTSTNKATATETSASSKHLHTRSQEIQKFFQQQLHQFHTQHNQSLYAKQKQTQFSMSSLAAEPLSLKPDDLLSNGSDAKINGKGMENSTSSSKSSSEAAAASSKPCFKSGGLGEILQFMELIGNLKHTKRTGWVLRDVNDCESISGHMYRMSMMTFLLDGTEGLNQIRCMELALVHDLAESLVGDITPFCGVSKEDKRAMEFKAMDDICKLIEPRGKRIMELFEEYEEGESAESKFVKDLDRLDMVMQAFEYEKRDDCLLKHQEFFDSTEGKFKHPFVQQLVNEIYEQRRNLAKAKGATPPPAIVVPNMDDPATSNNSNGHCATAELVQKSSSSSSS